MSEPIGTDPGAEMECPARDGGHFARRQNSHLFPCSCQWGESLLADTAFRACFSARLDITDGRHTQPITPVRVPLPRGTH